MATILIVEDEFAISEMLGMVLSDEGYRVLTAYNGRQGLERLAEGPRPDLIISDFMMPILDGVGMLKTMREIETQRDIPCIIMTAMPEANLRARIDGYAAFIRKPFDLNAIVQLVATILGVSQAASRRANQC